MKSLEEILGIKHLVRGSHRFEVFTDYDISLSVLRKTGHRKSPLIVVDTLDSNWWIWRDAGLLNSSIRGTPPW